MYDPDTLKRLNRLAAKAAAQDRRRRIANANEWQSRAARNLARGYVAIGCAQDRQGVRELGRLT